ncbi:MFS family permease [Streptacidiphilus sp. MAP12-33]|uniref:MFS transporter n=1 Tax=Streptacidiphilus sp. MAP12-33 TaxID=3156266 RepID=UPI003518911D
MTTTAHTSQGPRPATGAGLVTRPLALTFLASFAALVSLYLLFSVLPRYAAGASGGSGSGAGLVTGALLSGTVVAELTGFRLTRRLGHRRALAAGAVLLGVPAAALLLPGGLGFAAVTGVALVCGYGFGLGTVVAGALVAGLVPPDRVGEGLGLYGVVECVPAIAALPSGLWIAGHWGPATVVLLAVVVALVPLVALPRVPVASEGGRRHGGSEQPPGLLGALRNPGMRVPFLVFASTTVVAGTVESLLPLATGFAGGVAIVGLLAQSLTATASRWFAGRLGDRLGHARLLVPGLCLAAAGTACLIRLDLVPVVVGMCLFGAGFGAVQNATFTLMVDRSPASDPDTPSALWNLAFDGGFGAGPAVVGPLAGALGYPLAFALTALPMLAATPLAYGSGSDVGAALLRRRDA